MALMRTFLHNTATGDYFDGLNWGPGVERAFDFKLTERVIRFVRDSDLNPAELELILAFDDPRLNIMLPMDQRFMCTPKGVGASPGLEERV